MGSTLRRERRHDRVAAGLGGIVLMTALTALAAPLQGQARVVVGSIVEDATGAPLAGVDVRVIGTQLSIVSRGDGTFTISGAPPGPRVLYLRKLGYKAEMFPFRVSEDTTSVALQLTRVVQTLSAVAIEARSVHEKLELSGFNWRRKSGTAPDRNFMTRADIEKERPLRLSDMLRRRGLSANRCNLFVDGALVADPRAVYGRAAGRNASTSTLDWLGPDEVQGIEVFNRASQVPSEFNVTSPQGTKAGCVLLVWTR